MYEIYVVCPCCQSETTLEAYQESVDVLIPTLPDGIDGPIEWLFDSTAHASLDDDMSICCSSCQAEFTQEEAEELIRTTGREEPS